MTTSNNLLSERLKAHAHTFHKVIDFNPLKDKLKYMDFTLENSSLASIDLLDTPTFSAYISQQLKDSHARYGIGGYNELRTVYARSKVFDPLKVNEEPRRLHLGIDIWGEVGTPVYAPLGGMVHSFAFNDAFGDYGATIILMHQLDTMTFYTLYGHLSLEDLSKLSEYQYIIRGHVIGHFGNSEENGHWPPHLHFQVIKEIFTNKGDYPGVCKLSESNKYLQNCPDPDSILNMMQYIS